LPSIQVVDRQTNPFPFVLHCSLQNRAPTKAYHPADYVVYFQDVYLKEDGPDGSAGGYYSSSPISGDLQGFLEEDFQSNRCGWGSMKFALDETLFQEGNIYTVRLGFAEIFKRLCGEGKRVDHHRW